MSSSQIMKWLGVLVVPGLAVLYVLISPRATTGPRERAWYVRMWIFVAVMLAVSEALFELLTRHLYFYSQGILIVTMLTVPWFTRRTSLAREEDSRTD